MTMAERAAQRRGPRHLARLTRSIARPEGGGRAASGSAPAAVRQWPVLVVLSVVLGGLLLTLVDFRAGTLTVGLGMLVAVGLRWAVASVGMLAVRSRFTDLLTYGVLGVGIVSLSLMAQPDPWLEVPVLEDVVHFVIR